MTRKTRIVAFVCTSILTPSVFPQQYRVDPRNIYERVQLRVPLTRLFWSELRVSTTGPRWIKPRLL